MFASIAWGVDAVNKLLNAQPLLKYIHIYKRNLPESMLNKHPTETLITTQQ